MHPVAEMLIPRRRDQAEHHPEECEAGDEGGLLSLLAGHRLRRGLRLPGAHRHGEPGHGSEDLRQPRRRGAAAGTTTPSAACIVYSVRWNMFKCRNVKTKTEDSFILDLINVSSSCLELFFL